MPDKAVSVSKGKGDESLGPRGQVAILRFPQGGERGPCHGWVWPDGRLFEHPKHGILYFTLGRL